MRACGGRLADTAAILSMLALAATCGVVLSVASVWEDPRIEEVEGHLAGANCGGCGYTGCSAAVDERIKSMTEVALATSEKEALAEASPCLNCCGICYDRHAARRMPSLLWSIDRMIGISGAPILPLITPTAHEQQWQIRLAK